MRLILVDGIPSWQDGDLTLPIVAGGQEDPFDEIFGTSGEEEEITTADLSAFVGRTLLDINTGFFGIVRTRFDRNLGQVYWLSDPNTGRAQDLKTGATLVDPNTRQVTNIGASSTGSAAGSIVTSGGKLSEDDLRRVFGISDPAPAGRAPPSFASTQAAQTQQEEFLREQDRLNREFRQEQDRLAREATAEQNRLAEEAALKRGRLSTLTDLIQSFVASQSQARDTLANLQPDPFRFAAVAGGIAPFGVTPQRGFQTQLQEFAGAPVPTADPNAPLPSIESAIQGLTGANVPLSPQVFGAAGGATIPAPPPGQSIAVKVGEKGEEILRITAQGVEVIPIAAAAQEGGFFPFEPIPFNKETLLPALGTSGIFGSLGIPNVPQSALASGFGTRTAIGDFPAGGFLGTLSTLGVEPKLIQNAGTGQIFFVDEQGRTRFIPDPEASGVNLADVTRLTPGDFQSIYGPAPHDPNITGQFFPPVSTEGTSPFTRRPTPIVEPTTGTLLPAPFTVASQLNRLRLTRPALFNLLLSAYKAAGEPIEAVLGNIQASLPFGQERTLTGLR